MIMLHEVAPSGPVLSLFSTSFYSLLDLLLTALNRMREEQVLKDAGFLSGVVTL